MNFVFVKVSFEKHLPQNRPIVLKIEFGLYNEKNLYTYKETRQAVFSSEYTL